jgi:zinc-ribbon domain
MDWHVLLAQHTRTLLYIGAGVVLLGLLLIARGFFSMRRGASLSLNGSSTRDNVEPIDRGILAVCTHCGTKMSPAQSFCPDCGYAQPMTPTGSAPRSFS